MADSRARYWRATIDQIGVPEPFDVTQFARRAASYRQREIRLTEIFTTWLPVYALCISTHDTDYIYYRSGITPLHTAHIILHEIAHLLLGHQAGIPVAGDLARLLAPELSTRLTQITLGNPADTAQRRPTEEWDAETLAYLILLRHLRNRRPTEPSRRRRQRQQVAHERLRPLWTALRNAVPGIPCTACSPGPGGIGVRLYRRVIGIRDGELALRLCHDRVATLPTPPGTSCTLNTATVAIAALQAAAPRHRPEETRLPGDSSDTPPDLDLDAEAAQLLNANEIFTSVLRRSAGDHASAVAHRCHRTCRPHVSVSRCLYTNHPDRLLRQNGS